jgi:hypothetical protein
MNLNLLNLKRATAVNVDAVCAFIASSQYCSGEIPWCRGDKTDPWDHVEAAMGLAVGGCLAEARRAFAWLAQTQNDDGSWYAAYRQGCPEDRTRDANMSTYIAVGLYHHYLISGDLELVAGLWTTVERAVDFALRLQAPGGEIHWAISPEGRVDPVALLTGSSSIYMSLKCALACARLLGIERPAWRRALAKLRQAIQNKPHLFNMTKSRFSMDWFYPVLCGAVTGEAAQRRIDRLWKKFVLDGQGVLCVSDAPWVTLAETCELVLTLSALGNRNLAEIVFGWIGDKRFADGSYWTGYTYPDMVVWPEERFTWTHAAVLIAADALYQLTPAGRIFEHRFWDSEDGVS